MNEMLDLAAAGNWEEVEAIAQLGRVHRSTPSVFEWGEMLAGGRDTPKRPRKRV